MPWAHSTVQTPTPLATPPQATILDVPSTPHAADPKVSVLDVPSSPLQDVPRRHMEVPRLHVANERRRVNAELRHARDTGMLRSKGLKSRFISKDGTLLPPPRMLMIMAPTTVPAGPSARAMTPAALH